MTCKHEYELKAYESCEDHHMCSLRPSKKMTLGVNDDYVGEWD